MHSAPGRTLPDPARWGFRHTLIIRAGATSRTPGVLLLAEIDLSVGAVALTGGVIAVKYRCPLVPGRGTAVTSWPVVSCPSSSFCAIDSKAANSVNGPVLIFLMPVSCHSATFWANGRGLG